jgi:hypothetical protein
MFPSVRLKGKMIDAMKLGALLYGLLVTSWLHAAMPVEVALVSQLDERRGFCIDTVGFQARAQPGSGLQTHTCYSYQGKLAVDQTFDAATISKRMFRIIAFDLCMTAHSLSAGSRFGLETCDGRDTQQFEHRPTGQIVALAAPENCVTSGEGPSRRGQGGNPTHLIRALTLEACDSSRSDRQLWRLRLSAN